MSKIINLLPRIKNSQFANCRSISSTNCTFIDRKWREQRGLPENPNSFGPLTNFPDYTFMDGRPTPLGMNQTRRLLKQREVAAKIATMCKEIDFAKERYTKMQQEKESERQRKLSQKFKPKGHLLLKK